MDEKVYDPYVENHTIQFETRAGQEIDGPLGGARTVVLEAEYGLNDRVSLALVGDISREAGQASRFTGLGLEGVVYLGQIPKLGVDAGLYLEYMRGFQGESDAGETSCCWLGPPGTSRASSTSSSSAHSGSCGQGYASYGYAASATWRAIGGVRLGAEAFGDLGDDHGFLNRPLGAYGGPLLKWEAHPSFSPVEIKLDAGWLKAVGANRGEAGSQVRLTLELERPIPTAKGRTALRNVTIRRAQGLPVGGASTTGGSDRPVRSSGLRKRLTQPTTQCRRWAARRTS